MGFFDFLKPINEEEKKFRESVDRTFKVLSPFTHSSVGLLVDSVWAKEGNLEKIDLYFFGAIDAIGQMEGHTTEQSKMLLHAFFCHTHTLNDIEATQRVDDTIRNLAIPKFEEIMKRGGETFLAWHNGKSSAPMALKEILYE